MHRRVVITGIGTVCGLGVGASAMWDALIAGHSAVRRTAGFDASGFASPYSAELPGFSARDHVPKHYRKALKVMARDTEMAVACAKFAVEDAGLLTNAVLPEDAPEGTATTYAPARVGCQIGAGLISAEVPELAAAMSASVDSSTGDASAGGFSLAKWGGGGAANPGENAGMDNLTPLWLLKYLPNMLACHVTILHDARGPSNTITCSEASGLLSIGESMRVIERGAADACFSGSCESKINPMGLLRIGFADRLAPASAFSDAEPWNAVRPFDATARGGVLGEGGGILMLECRETAHARGARVRAELLGFGAGLSSTLNGGDDGEGLRGAIESALDDAGCRADEIDAIIPQGAGALGPDRAELAALRGVFGGGPGGGLSRVPMVTLAPMLGECVAGAGGLAVAVGALAVAHQTLPARLHGGECPTDVLAGASPARDARLRRVLVCTSSLGGQAAAVVLAPSA
ncbi:MAG: beta-ketoacyl synthase N-terminal-like domain-containing protein [Phycisphaerales bacterium]